jgi:Fic family protein
MSAQRLWNWQQHDWPRFRFDASRLVPLEAEFLRQSGVFSGAIRHVEEDEKQELVVELMSEEAVNTSEIEGEMLSRDSLQSSIRRTFGLSSDNHQPSTIFHV